MLTQETKRKIDSARNILVGKVPDPKAQVEQITTALIYKFMDDMDKEAIELGGKARFFTKGFEKYAWTKLLDQKLGGHERLELYGEAVAKMSQNPHIPQLFRDIFKDAFLPYRSPETLTLFLKEINGFTYDHSEDLGNAFEYLLSILGSQGDAGQFRTPRHIIDFIAEVVDPKKGDTILDPACGTAGFLISAYKHILKQQKDKPLTPDEKKKLMNNLVGYDISPDMVKLSKVNMYLHGFAEPKIFEYDTLSSEEKWDEMYDVIMANPPFMSPSGGIRPHKRFSVQANRSEVLFVDYIKEHLRPNGRAGIIVPEGIIFQSAGAYKQLRKILVEDGLFAVVSLPAGVFNPYSGVKTSILFFDNSLAKKTDKILFVRVLNDGFDLGAQRRPVDRNDLVRPDNEVDATKVLKGQRIAIETGTSNPWLQENSLFAYEITKKQIAQSSDYNLSAERYRLDNLGEQKTQKYPVVELGEVCDLMNGYAFKSDNYVDSGTRVIRITNVQKGKIVDDNPKFYPKDTKEPVEKYKLLEGDLLISLTGNVGRAGLLSKELLPAALNQRVACLRVNSEKINPKFLFSLLNKDDFENDCINASSGVAQKNLSTVWLSEYKIPLPPIGVQKEIVEQIEVKQNAIEHAKAIIENLERERRYFGQSLRKQENIEWVELGEVFETSSGGTPMKNKEGYYKNGTIPWLKSGEVNQGLIFHVEEKITPEGLKNSSAKIFPVDTVLVAMYGATAGKVGLLKVESSTNQAVCGIFPNAKIIPEFLYHYLRTQSDEMVKLSTGGAQPNISQGIIRKIKIPLPALKVQKQMVEEVEEEEKIITANRQLIEVMEKKISAVLSEV